MSIVSGKVEAVSQNETRYGVKLCGIWYNGFGKCPVEKGQEITAEVEEVTKNDLPYHNFKKLIGIKDQIQEEKKIAIKEITDDDIKEEENFISYIYSTLAEKLQNNGKVVSDLAISNMVCEIYRFIRWRYF